MAKEHKCKQTRAQMHTQHTHTYIHIYNGRHTHTHTIERVFIVPGSWGVLCWVLCGVMLHG